MQGNDRRVQYLDQAFYLGISVFLIDATGVPVWWTCGGVTPAVGAAIAPADPNEPMSMKLERVGKSRSFIPPIQYLHQLTLPFVAASTCRRLLSIVPCRTRDSPLVLSHDEHE